jgi:hypothetical protein
VALGVGDGELESLGEGLGVGLGDTDADGVGSGLVLVAQLGDTAGDGLALGSQVGDGDARCGVGTYPEVGLDCDGVGEAAGPPGRGCPLRGLEFWLLGDTAVETSIAT